MSELKVTVNLQDDNAEQDKKLEKKAMSSSQLTWETPRMEDVSEQVMAQPYIRFT